MRHTWLFADRVRCFHLHKSLMPYHPVPSQQCHLSTDSRVLRKLSDKSQMLKRTAPCKMTLTHTIDCVTEKEIYNKQVN